jgi:hypothetical protein
MIRPALFAVFAITFALPQETTFSAFHPPSAALAPSADGLRIRISAVTTTLSTQGATFTIALQNTSDADFVVNLGIMLGNGKIMLPAAVHLLLTDRIFGRTLDLQFCGGPPGIAGRVDDYTVALQAGATFAFPASLDKYCNRATTRRGVTLLPGRYQISARFDGRGANRNNGDMAGVALLNFWKGTIQSDVLEFDVSN